MMILAIAAFMGTVFTFAYATLLHAFLSMRPTIAAIFGVLATLLTFIGLSAIGLSGSRQVDAGGVLAHLYFISTATLIGGPLGWKIFRSAFEQISQRG